MSLKSFQLWQKLMTVT